MLFNFAIGYRLAFLALAALTLAAAIPLAFAWARILPDEPPPFEVAPAPTRTWGSEPGQESVPRSKRDPIAIVLLVFVTLSYAVQFPGFPRQAALAWLHAIVSGPPEEYILLGVKTFLVAVTAAAVCYSIFRSHPSRVSLSVGAALVLLLWLLAPELYAALLATS